MGGGVDCLHTVVSAPSFIRKRCSANFVTGGNRILRRYVAHADRHTRGVTLVTTCVSCLVGLRRGGDKLTTSGHPVDG